MRGARDAIVAAHRDAIIMFRRQLTNRAWRDALRGGRRAPSAIAVRTRGDARAERRARRRRRARERWTIDQPYASRLTNETRGARRRRARAGRTARDF